VIYLATGSWMLSMALLSDHPRLRDHPASLGVGVGALLAGLLLTVPALGTALATLAPAGGDVVRELVVAQSAWLVAAAAGLAGYAASRAARRLRGPRALVAEVAGLAALVAPVPATAHHLTSMLVLVPAAAAAVAAAVLEEQPRPVAVLAGLLGTATFALGFGTSRALAGSAIAWLLAGTTALAYAVGRWTDLHPASSRRPGPLLWVGLACGFLLVYRV
jgi:hypothetical protein